MTQGRKDSLQRIADPLGWLRGYLQSWGLERFARRYYGIYPAVVLDNNDPDGRGRIRAIIPALGMKTSEDVSENFWALPCMDGLGTDPDTGQMTGTFHPPDEKTNVWVSFQYGDPRFPVYMGGFITTGNKSDTFSAENALRKGVRTKTGHFIRMSDDPEDLHLTIGKGDGEGEPSPSFISMTKEGSVLVSNDQGSMVYMNAEDNELSLVCGKTEGDTVRTLSFLLLKDDEISMGTRSGGAISIKGKNHTVTGDNYVADLSRDFVANSGGVKLGKGAKEPAVRGLKLAKWALLHQHTVTVPVAGSVTGPGPFPPPVLHRELSEKVFIA